MTVREQLIEILRKPIFPHELADPTEAVADYLLDNGATVQREGKLYWKPVRSGVWHLTCSACDSHLGCSEEDKYCPKCGARFVKYVPVPPATCKAPGKER